MGVTVAELIAQLQAMPQDAIAVNEDELEVIALYASPNRAAVIIWAEQK